MAMAIIVCRMYSLKIKVTKMQILLIQMYVQE